MSRTESKPSGTVSFEKIKFEAFLHPYAPEQGMYSMDAAALIRQPHRFTQIGPWCIIESNHQLSEHMKTAAAMGVFADITDKFDVSTYYPGPVNSWEAISI